MMLRISSLQATQLLFHPILPLVSVVVLWANFDLQSIPIGIASLILFFYPNTRILTKILYRENQRFSSFLGMMINFSLIILIGYISYLVYDFSNIIIICNLTIITLIISIIYNLNRVTPELQLGLNINTFKISLGGRNLKKSPNLVVECFFIVLITYSFILIFDARTGESIISPWSVMPPTFFVVLPIAVSLLCYIAITNKMSYHKLLSYIFLLYLIPGLGFTIVTINPFTGVNTTYAETNRQLFYFGKFITDFSQQEALSSPIRKAILQTGGHFLDTTIAKFLQINPTFINIYSVPILFNIMVVGSSYGLAMLLRPNNQKFIFIMAVAFFSSQFNIFLYTPPGKPETLALGFLIISVYLWLRYLKRQLLRELIPPILTSAATILIHQYVGLIAIYVVAMVLILKYLPAKSSKYSILKISFIFLLIVSPSIILLPIFDKISRLINLPETHFKISGSLNISRTFDLLFPAFTWNEKLTSNAERVFDGYINNYIYFLYALILLGVFTGILLKIDKDFLTIFVGLVLICLQIMILVENFMPTETSYRFLYYSSLLSFPLISIGIYGAVRKSLGNGIL